jgi:enediyne biosynthesis protein E4
MRAAVFHVMRVAGARSEVEWETRLADAIIRLLQQATIARRRHTGAPLFKPAPSGLGVVLLAVLFFGGPLNVTSETQAQSEARLPSSAVPGKFVDVTSAKAVHFRHIASKTSKKYLIETMGPGVALFDYDNDGLLDLFVVNGAPLADPTPPGTIPQKTAPEYWDRLYRQTREGAFEDVTDTAGLRGFGYEMGVAVGDYDNDGFEDLYVTGHGGNRLYHNNRDGTFSDVTEKAGVGGAGWSASAAWVDLDDDGRLDLVVLRYLEWDFNDIWCGERKEGYRSYCHPDQFQAIAPLVYHNDGNGEFTEVAQRIGMSKPGKGLGIAVADYDRDARTDLYVANDSVPQFLYRNRGDGTFEEVALLSEAAVDGNGRAFAGMGVDFSDYTNDGLPDLIVTNLAYQMYAAFQNRGDGTFSYATHTSGIGVMTLLHSGWGVRFLDYDNDGWKDLLIGQSHVLDTVELSFPQLRYREPMLLARNTGRGFVDVSADSGAPFQTPWAARGMAVGDIDNDGRLDAVVTTNDGPLYVLRNDTLTKNHWLLLNLVGRRSNRDAIGAEVIVRSGQGQQVATVTTAGSYLSSSDKRVHFGLGRDTVASIDIRWPSGTVQRLKDVRADQILRVEEPEGAAPVAPRQ